MMQAVRTTIRMCLGSLIAVTAMAHGTSTAHAGPANVPLRLHPNNPRYFQFRGKPAMLITSGEHYGAVINLDFDYVAYLDALARCGFNHTRLFSGTYREIPGSFGIQGNTLAPARQRYAAPWARSDTPGYFDGGNKFDLTRWDEPYFERLKDFAGKLGNAALSSKGQGDRVRSDPIPCAQFSNSLSDRIGRGKTAFHHRWTQAEQLPNLNTKQA